MKIYLFAFFRPKFQASHYRIVITESHYLSPAPTVTAHYTLCYRIPTPCNVIHLSPNSSLPSPFSQPQPVSVAYTQHPTPRPTPPRPPSAPATCWWPQQVREAAERPPTLYPCYLFSSHSRCLCLPFPEQQTQLIDIIIMYQLLRNQAITRYNAKKIS